MCDQDHYDDDLHDFEARGMVTRRQFGILLGAGMLMALPRVAGAVAVTESDVTITAPRTPTSCTRQAAPRRLCWCGPTSSAYAQPSGRWASD